MGWGYSRFAPYVSVRELRAKAYKKIAQLKMEGIITKPVVIEGRTIAKTFWGKSWCQHLESYSDFDNRLPRGRTYVRNGSVIDLQLSAGKVEAMVSGSSIYKVKIAFNPVTREKWYAIVNECSGKIDSLIELLQGKFSKGVMEVITQKDSGLFPGPDEIKLDCSCPDYATMCKHVAAVLYGIGARLDEQPEELFLLRQADHVELIAKAGSASLIIEPSDTTLDGEDLSTLFGIDIAQSSSTKSVKKPIKAVVKTTNSIKKKTVKISAKTTKSVRKTAAAEKPIEKKTLSRQTSSAARTKRASKDDGSK